MKEHQKQERRAKILESLYKDSGRSNGLYTGLWEEFCQDLGRSFVEKDYEELHKEVVTALQKTESVYDDVLAHAAIKACRKALLQKP